MAGQRLYGGKVIRYPLFPFDTDSRSESCQMDIFISGVYEAADHVPGSHVYLTVLSGTVKVTCGGEVFRLESRDPPLPAGAGGGGSMSTWATPPFGCWSG